MTVLKDKTVRSLAGFIIILLLVLQNVFVIDISAILCVIGLNLFQYGFTGWCPIAIFFQKIGWLQNHNNERKAKNEHQ